TTGSPPTAPAGSAAPGSGDDRPEAREILIKVLRRDPLPFPGPAPVGVAEVGLLVMVPSAEAGEVVELRDLGPPEGVAVVEFEVPPDVAARDDALGVPDLERAAEMSRDRPPAMGDPDDIDAVGENHLQDGVFAHPADHGDRNGPETGKLAPLAG